MVTATATRLRACDGCGKKLQEREVFSFKEKTFCRDCYLGDSGLGPLAGDYLECPHCGTVLHKFTVVCFNCKKAIREVGKIQTESRYMGLRVLVYVVAVILAIVLPIALGPVGVDRGGSTVRAVVLGAAGSLSFLGGLFRGLFPMVFVRSRILGNFLAGALAWLLAVLGLVLLVFLPFP